VFSAYILQKLQCTNNISEFKIGVLKFADEIWDFVLCFCSFQRAMETRRIGHGVWGTRSLSK